MGRHEVGGKWVRGVVEGRTWRDMSGVRGHPQWEEPALDPPSAVTQVWLCRSMWLPSLCPPTPPPSTVRAANPSTQCWVRPTSACGPTEASASSVSRYCGTGGGRGRRGGARGAATPPLSSPRSAITPPSPLATPSPTTSSSGKVGAGLRGPRMGSQSGPDPHLPPSPRHEVEEQILGQILGDRPGGHRQRPPAQVSTHPPLTPPPPALCSRPPQPEPAVGRSGDHFEWNKVTTCIHNVLSGPRWIEHYGEVLIRNTRDASYHCKITFCKVRPAHRVATPPSAQAPPTRRCSMLCSLSGPAPSNHAPIQAPPLRPSPQPITDRRLPHSFPTRAAPFVNGPTSPRGPAL